MSQVLIVIVITYGSLLNLLAKPWSSTESLLERRRNDILALLLWLLLLILAILTVHSGIANTTTDDAFDLQDWTALILPFALAAPYLLELVATLVRQLEMWPWMRAACIQALPLAWLYRTMTVAEQDPDGEWFRSGLWRPSPPTLKNLSSASASSPKTKGFWSATSRRASLHHLFHTWLTVLLSATRYTSSRLRHSVRKRHPAASLSAICTLIITVVLTVAMALLYACSLLEYALLLCFDALWWSHCHVREYILPRYDTVHFGRQEMQSIFEQSIFEQSISIKRSLQVHEGISTERVHDRIMTAVITTTAVLENAFRRAYLVVPVYDFPLSNRKALRERYAFVGCDLDRLIKQVRLLLEVRHTSGLLSITSSTGTIEASLHNNIESILSIALFFSTSVLYWIAARVARLEAQIEERIRNRPGMTPEAITRERVVYIDARNAMFWLLWIVVTAEWNDLAKFWNSTPCDVLDSDEQHRAQTRFPESRIESLYVIATFLSRCRYADRYGFQDENAFYPEVRELGYSLGKKNIEEEFGAMSRALEESRSVSLLEWTAKEYGLKWEERSRDGEERLRCTWETDTGTRREAECNIVL